MLSARMNPTRRDLIKTFSAAAVARSASAGSVDLPRIDVAFGRARIYTEGRDLTVETGVVLRRWRITSDGFVTTAWTHLRTGKKWAAPSSRLCDWSLAGFGLEGASCRLADLSARPVRFDPYTSDRLEVVAEFAYPDLTLRWTAWVYPDAPGIRTQLALKGSPRSALAMKPSAIDHLPADCSRAVRRAAGYYNDTQHRNTRETEILREEVRQGPQTRPEIFDWSSLVSIESGSEGVCVIKESHKCVNQPGVDTGAFECGPSGLVTTGWGIGPGDLLPGRFRDAWATWSIAFDGGSDGRELAIKTMDRCRYPVDPSRDIYIMSNTWGSGTTGQQSKNAAREENVLRQIDACRDLGIDVLQIDDGWQGNSYDHWDPSPESYPHGWSPVREAARRAGVKLGLWCSWTIREDDLERNYDHGGFQYFKVDFAKLSSYQKVEALVDKIRALVDYSGQSVRVNWDVTENAPRMGYYFGREFGSVYLENRKPETPPQAVYVPYLVLRDAWQVSKYACLNKFQTSIQNLDRVSHERSNAFRYNHAYSVAIALMGTPLFFQEVALYSPEARDLIRPLIAVYKRHRQAMFEGHVFPIGDKPSDASWTGFQNHHPATMTGYLLVFRELNSRAARQALALKFLSGRRIRLTDLRSGGERVVTVPADGGVSFELKSAADFGFYRYEPAERKVLA